MFGQGGEGGVGVIFFKYLMQTDMSPYFSGTLHRDGVGVFKLNNYYKLPILYTPKNKVLGSASRTFQDTPRMVIFAQF